ncbi:MAG: beta-Ala-His dipeptidase [Lachnospiraceae bacterium]|nr:beta-Ala-His dipeptidase [Lachnospiraceae bacterium]
MSKSYMDFFREISAVPRGSGYNEKISNYLVNFAKERGLSYIQDESLNVIIKKEKHPDYKGDDVYIIQGHMDMVCEKVSGSSHDFENEGLELIEKDGFLSAKDTTLGADDGICVAYALALLDSDSLVLPGLEVIITTDEETGMFGAKAIDVSGLKGYKVINIDSEDEGVIIAGCAGGIRVRLSRSFTPEKLQLSKNSKLVNYKIYGLKGGHSGDKIGEGRSNAVYTMFRALDEFMELASIHIQSVIGGNKDNAIPNECSARIIINTDNPHETDKYLSNLKNISENIKQELKASEPGLKYDIIVDDNNDSFKEAMVIPSKAFEDIKNFIIVAPNGVCSRTYNRQELVESSLNLGILGLNTESLDMVYSVRSSVKSKKNHIVNILRKCAKAYNIAFETGGDYPAWEYRENSDFRDGVVKTYKEMYNEEPKVDIIHAGLECGILSEKRPDFDIISIGPDIYDIHTVNERLDLKSAERVYEFLVKVLT